MKNLYAVLGRTAHETKESVQKYGSSFGKVAIKLTFLLNLLFVGFTNAQITTTTWNFAANSTGWTGNFSRSTVTNASMCGTAAMRRNLWSSPTTGNLVSPILPGTNNLGQITLTYKYKAANYSSPYAAANPWGYFNVQVGNTATGPWTTVQAVSQETQTGSCITKTVTFTPPSGNLYIKWDCFWTVGDYWLSFDDITVSQAAAVACSGTPAPGNTIASAAAVAPGSTVNLSLQNSTAGTGVTYQWQSASSSTGPWTNFGTSTATQTTPAITANTWYRCLVTCSGNTGTSTATQVTLTYCTPSSSSVDGTGITNVTFGTGPTVNNTTGAETNNYGNYSSQSGGLYQGQSATVAITFTTSIYDYNTVVWVDWNNDLDFADAGEQVYTGLSTTTAPNTLNATFTVPATATIGANYRMRIGAGDAAAPSYCTTGATYTCFEDYTITVLAPCVPAGNQTTYGAGSWIGYVYNSATPGAFSTYSGFVTESTTFNRTHTSATGATTNLCFNNQDLFTIRYKNTTNFPAAYYTFSVGGDDGVRFSVDGGATWLINNWIDQGYTVSSNPTPIFLSGNVNMVFEYYENSGGAQSSFSYISAPACSGTPTPGNTVASATAVVAGGTSNLSLQNATAGGGVTYQWQSATSSTGPWTSISGATLPTYTATVTANTWYQCIVTCTASSATATSSPVQITLTYCIPTGTAAYYITNVITTAGITNISNATAANGGYGNFTAQSASNSIGTGTNFSIAHSATVGGAGVGVWIDWNNDLDFADANEQIANSAAWNYSPYTGTINIPAGTPVGNYRMRVVIDYNATSPIACPVGISGETEDYTFSVSTPPACAVPTALTSSAVTSATATISWTAASPAPTSGYEYFVSTSATAPTVGSTPTGTTAAGITTASLTGLTANTTYYFWVRSNCGGANGTSVWAGSSSFFTGPCVPSGTAAYYITNVTTTGGTTNISNATASNGGYGNFTAQSASNSIGTATNFSIAHTATGGGAGVGVWINWNNDMDFADANEQIAISAAWNYSPYTGTINIPAGTPAGNYQMRVVIDYNATSPIPCSVGISGESEDYTFTVIALPPCAGTPNPGATTATSTQVFAAGSTTLGITTAQNGTGITFQWQSGASASGPWTNISGATNATYVASPITATYYQCVVTCSNGGVTGTSTPIQISVNPYCEPVYTTGKTSGDLISNISIAGTTLSNNSGTAATNPAYTFFTGQPNYTCDLVAANSYTVNVTIGTWGSQGIAAWIDYNDNNIFEASELIGSTATTIGTGTGGTPIPANHTASFTINLSCTPPLGTHRMRVRDVYFVNGPTIDPCATYTFGETEDYLVNIIAGPAFTPAFTTTPAATSCIGTTVNYVATAGQTNYAWTFAGTAGTDYTLVSGGTSTSNTASVTWITGGAHSMTMNYASPLGCASSGAVSNTVTMPTAGTSLSQDNENATCIVNQNGWVHFYHSSGRLIGSINSQGQNLGAVTVTSYVDPTNALVPACTNPNPIYSTSVMQRHWVITPTNQPTTAVLVRFPYSNAEFSGLTSAASTNANPNDDLLTPADLGMTKYSNGTAANVNGDATDNCGSGTSTFHTQLGNGSATTYSAVSANYVDFSIPGFSEFWLHGSAQSSPLPVELVNFQANCNGEGKVNVTWATASEHNSANFTVEKSRDGINWTVMASLAGAGNSTQMINYSTVDNNAAAGVNYYRLTQTDFDGASETFNIASANCGDNSSLTTVKVYPNPSAGDFYIDFTSEEITGASVITITDARGMEVYKMNVTVEKGSNVFHIDHMEAAPGMYYIQVSNGTATSNIVKHSLR